MYIATIDVLADNWRLTNYFSTTIGNVKGQLARRADNDCFGILSAISDNELPGHGCQIVSQISMTFSLGSQTSDLRNYEPGHARTKTRSIVRNKSVLSDSNKWQYYYNCGSMRHRLSSRDLKSVNELLRPCWQCHRKIKYFSSFEYSRHIYFLMTAIIAHARNVVGE